MNAIKAVWTNGQIVPTGPVDWPEGSQLLVEPIGPAEKIGLDESEWSDSPEAIADWIAAVEKIEPIVWAEGEEEEYERFREELRQFNIEACASKWKKCPTVMRHETALPAGHRNRSGLSGATWRGPGESDRTKIARRSHRDLRAGLGGTVERRGM